MSRAIMSRAIIALIRVLNSPLENRTRIQYHYNNTLEPFIARHHFLINDVLIALDQGRPPPKAGHTRWVPPEGGVAEGREDAMGPMRITTWQLIT